jgi:hypothetical protein
MIVVRQVLFIGQGNFLNINSVMQSTLLIERQEDEK